ncbi:VanZ family protein [Oceanirhabdus seepicola]|uniref:VanZ family protein n=1 Tax=Oceanirhabdus seepicola TaxID=2828781 RepID=A0A9J6NYU1_9CLOT|nr:VanZ family protein [Oceanirhabdus seepicola]MCM1989142.1 VanZ family protein [Oceanirhabdus seepicola]
MKSNIKDIYNRFSNNPVFKISTKIIFFIYLFYLFYLVFLSSYYGRGVVHRNYNLTPFKTISEFLFFSNNMRAILRNIDGNIAAFVPMGFLLPLAFSKMNKYHKVFAAIITATLFIEISQFIFGVGTCDVDDVILNFVGGIIGYKLYNFITYYTTCNE